MSYKKKIYRFKNAIEIEEYHTARYGAPGQKRIPKRTVTPEQVERIKIETEDGIEIATIINDDEADESITVADGYVVRMKPKTD